jgi:prepilin-type N-terminal cleavage/methylation domain-containing protein
MSLTNIKSKIQSERGFTIVELLIVVVVIAILAAITIVSYNGITRSANDSAAKQQASTVAKKIESYQAKEGRYPVNATELVNANESYNLSIDNVMNNAASPALFTQSAPSGDDRTKKVVVRKCAAATPTPNTQAGVTSANISGIQVYYYDFNTSALTTSPTNLGTTTACPTS